MSSGLEIILAFGFTDFSFRVRDIIYRACFCSVHVYKYRIPFIFLLGIKFLRFVGMSLVGALLWCEGFGIGLIVDASGLSNVY